MNLKRLILLGASLLGLFSSNTTSAETCLSFPSGLVSFWRGETNTLDALGNHHGTAQGTLGYTNGVRGQGFQMDGDDYIDLGPWFNLQDFTISMWVRAEASQPSFGTLIDNNHTCCRSWVIHLNGGTQGEYGYGTSDAGQGIVFNLTPGEWHHLVFTRRADNYRKELYMDGVLIAEGQGSGAINYDGSQFLRLGNWVGGGRNFRGLMDEVAIFSRVLSLSEVSQVYSAVNGGLCTDATYLQTESLPKGFAGSPYTNTLATGISPQPHSFAVTTGTLPAGLALSTNGVIAGTPSILGTNTFTVAVTDGNGQVTARSFTLEVGDCLPVPRNLIGWWRGENNANDQVFTNHGVLREGGFTPGKVGTAISFDGVNDYIAVSNAAAFKPANVTLEAWIYPTNYNSGHNTVVAHGSGNDDNGYWLGTYNGEPRFWTRHNGYGMHLLNTAASIPLNQWTHIAATFDGAAKRLYVNGNLVATSHSLGSLIYDSDAVPITIGSDIAYHAPNHYFFGHIDEVGIYDRSLHTSEIVSIYNSGAYGKCAHDPYFRTTTLPQGGTGIPYSYSILAGVTPAPHTFTILNGNLPDGVEFSSNGQFDGTPISGITNNLRIRVTDTLGNSAEADFLLTVSSCLNPFPQPILWWRAENTGLDELSTNHFSLVNGATYAPGFVHTGLKFDGINDFASATNSTEVKPTNFTLEAWIKPESMSGFDGVLAKGASGLTPGMHGEADTWWLGLVDGYPRLYTFHPSGDQWISSPFPLAAGRWHHLAATFDGTRTRIFVNGIQVVEGAPSQPLVYDQGPVPVVVGQDWGNGAMGGSPFHGLIDEIAIYSVALSSNQLSSLYHASGAGKCGAFHISTLSPLPGAGEGEPYSELIEIANGTGPFTFALNGGALPVGLTLSTSGTIAGTPTVPGMNAFRVLVTDVEGRSAERQLRICVNARPVVPTIAGQSVDEMTPFVLNNASTDVDTDQSLVYTLLAAPANATISASGVIQWNPGEVDGPGTNTFITVATDNGTPSLSATNSFILVVNEVNVAPVLAIRTNRVIDELTTLTITNAATDSDIPFNTLTYSLIAAPSGATINPSTGIISWTPSEAQGSSVNTFTTRVVDNGSPVLSATNTFSVTVNEVNLAPVLSAQINRTIDELTALTVTNAATDSDIPVNTLTYSLLAGPSGAVIHPATGVITWTPSEGQGPSTNLITTRVVDNGSPNLSATNSFTVTVNEVNVAPVLSSINNRTINELTTLSVTNAATDSDLPANTLSYTLVAAPSGASINPTTGAITWTPSEVQGPSTNIFTTRVVDNGSPNLSATNSFTVTVSEVNLAPVLTVQTNRTINELTSLLVTNAAIDADIPVNTLTYSLLAAPSGAAIDPNSGIITWTPTEAQGPSTNTFTTLVVDNGSPNLSATNSFTVTVHEVNLAPTLSAQSNRTIDELTTLILTNAASDVDLPANTLTYSLLAAPSGAIINPNSGVINWTPSEAQGPSLNTFTTRVVDNGSPNLSATNSFTVTVDEVNVAPVLSSISDRTVNPGQTINVTATASDADLPANGLSYSLVSSTAGASVDPVSGVFAWRPAISQAGTTNTVEIRVTDNGSPALSHSRLFTVVVNELAPVTLVTLGVTGSEFRFEVQGTTGPDYILMSSADLTQWTDLSTNVSPTTPFQIGDSSVTNTNARYYRVRLAP